MSRSLLPPCLVTTASSTPSRSCLRTRNALSRYANSFCLSNHVHRNISVQVLHVIRASFPLDAYQKSAVLLLSVQYGYFLLKWVRRLSLFHLRINSTENPLFAQKAAGLSFFLYTSRWKDTNTWKLWHGCVCHTCSCFVCSLGEDDSSTIIQAWLKKANRSEAKEIIVWLLSYTPTGLTPWRRPQHLHHPGMAWRRPTVPWRRKYFNELNLKLPQI